MENKAGGVNMRWLHFSDIHFDFANDGISTKMLHDNFKVFVKKNNITVDEVFFTGDFRNAKNQDKQDLKIVAKEATDFIKEIASSVGVKDTSHIHIVPGNHDFITKVKVLEVIPYLTKFLWHLLMRVLLKYARVLVPEDRFHLTKSKQDRNQF